MIPIKIECGCGQRYAFDVEPVSGQMPSAVACPVCGADGTAAANAALAQNAPAQPRIAVANRPAVRVASRTPSEPPPVPQSPAQVVARRRTTLLPGQVDHAQAQVEARAKISWGDSPKQVIGYLMMQGFGREEASELVQEMFRERVATIRANGIKKLIFGAVLGPIRAILRDGRGPIVALVIFLSIGILPMKIFAFTIMAGLWGVWQIIKGLFMVLTPKSEPGDVAEQ